MVIAAAEFVFVYRARRCFHKAIAAGTVCADAFDTVIATQAKAAYLVDVIFTHNTVIRVIDLTHGAHAARITKLVRGECTAAFLAMVLFVAIARLRVIGAVGSAVAEPVVKSVAAAILTFGAVLVARKGGDRRRG